MVFISQMRWKLLLLDLDSRVKSGGHPVVTSDPEAGASRNPVFGDGARRAEHEQDGHNKKGWMEK